MGTKTSPLSQLCDIVYTLHIFMSLVLCIDHVSVVMLNFDNDDNCNNKKIACVNIVFRVAIVQYSL